MSSDGLCEASKGKDTNHHEMMTNFYISCLDLSTTHRYFQQNKLTSFQRQLNLYGFNRLTRGMDATGYYHEHFLRDREYLAKRMMRQRIKGTKIKGAASPDSEPDFYSMPPVMATLEEQQQVQHQYVVPSFSSSSSSVEPLTAVSQPPEEPPLVSCDDMSASHASEESSSDDDDDCHHQQQQFVVKRQDQQVPSDVPSMTDYTPQQGLITSANDDDDHMLMFADPADALLMDLQSMDPLEDFGLLVVPPSIRKDQALGDMLQHVLDSSLAV
eukprot:scaffold574_cov190-Amphora_coffeaeformis.AAC.18